MWIFVFGVSINLNQFDYQLLLLFAYTHYFHHLYYYHIIIAIKFDRSFRAFDSCKIVANIMSSLNLVEYVVDSFNNGVDVLRAGFHPEGAFSAMHGILGALNQTSSGRSGDPKKRTRTSCSFNQLQRYSNVD